MTGLADDSYAHSACVELLLFSSHAFAQKSANFTQSCSSEMRILLAVAMCLRLPCFGMSVVATRCRRWGLAAVR